MTPRAKPGYPPLADWDARLTGVACDALVPVRTVHRNPWFALRERGGYYTIECPQAQVAILASVAGEGLVLVRARRPVIDDLPWETPAGAAAEGETPEVAAARELAEETGIRISDTGRFVAAPPIAESANRVPHLNYVFSIELSREEFDTRGAHDEEIVSVELVARESLRRMVVSGEIYVPITATLVSRWLLAT